MSKEKKGEDEILEKLDEKKIPDISELKKNTDDLKSILFNRLELKDKTGLKSSSSSLLYSEINESLISSKDKGKSPEINELLISSKDKGKNPEIQESLNLQNKLSEIEEFSDRNQLFD